MAMQDQDITVYNETPNGEVREQKHSFTSDECIVYVATGKLMIYKANGNEEVTLVAEYSDREWLDFKYEQIFAR